MRLEVGSVYIRHSTGTLLLAIAEDMLVYVEDQKLVEVSKNKFKLNIVRQCSVERLVS